MRGFPDMPIATSLAYAALRRFSRLAGSDEFQMRYAFRPGDLVLFDNRRTLHGRTAIDETGGVRELHGTYIDHDEIYSRTACSLVIEPPASSGSPNGKQINQQGKPPCPASSSPAPSPAAATPSTSRRTSQSRPSRSPTRRSRRQSRRRGRALPRSRPRHGSPEPRPGPLQELTDRIRSSDTDVVLNLTGGTGADLTLGGVENPLPLSEEGTDMAGATERMRHVRECLPEIATIDMGTMNFGEGDYIMTNSTSQLDEIARQFQDLPVQPELECFDTGHLWYAKNQEERGLYEGKTMNAQLCMGVPWGAPDDMNTLMAMVNNGHRTGTSRRSPSVAASWSTSPLRRCGRQHSRGLEDNLYLSKGVKPPTPNSSSAPR